MNSHRQLNFNNAQSAKNMEKLSSGFRINRAGDDAAGLAISEKMRGQIRGLNMASKNAQDSISLIQTAEGALNETHSILQRMRELAVQSANDTNTTSDRQELQKEINQLTDEIDRIRNTTEFNTQKLLNGDKVGIVQAQDGKVSLQNNSQLTLDADFSTSGVAGNLAKSFTVTITRTDLGNASGIAKDFTISAPQLSAAELSGLVTIASGGQSTITLASGTLATDATTINVGGSSGANTLDKLKVGESVTISITAAVAAQNNIEKGLTMQIGANTGQSINVGINDMSATALGVRDASGNGIDITDSRKATTAITAINNAIESVSAERSKLGAVQNRLEHTINNLGTASENLQAAESRIRDVDMAKEMMTFTKNNILTQAAQAMLAQANQQPQGVLQLLR